MQCLKEVVMDYIKALDQRDYGSAIKLIHDDVKIIGPAGEGFGDLKVSLK